MDRGAWQATAHGVEENQTRLSMHTVVNIQWLSPGIKPVSPALQVDSLPLSHGGSPLVTLYQYNGFLCILTNCIL